MHSSFFLPYFCGTNSNSSDDKKHLLKHCAAFNGIFHDGTSNHLQYQWNGGR